MKTTAFTAASLLALASAATAQISVSAPFQLHIDSHEAKYAALVLSACHTGAAEESLCIEGGSTTPTNYNTFTLNRTVLGGGNQPPVSDTTPGTLVFNLTVAGGDVISEPLSLNYGPYSNVAEALFLPGGYGNVEVGFDGDNVMNLYGKNASLYWQLCDSNVLGYQYTNLAWIVGGGKPQAGVDCSPVNVTRVFV